MMKRFFVMVRKNTMLVIAFAMISAMTLTAVANIDNGKAVTSPRLFYNGQELTDGAMIPRGGIITAEYDFVLSGKDREITVVLPDNLVPARDNGLLYLYNNNDELLGQLPLDDIIDSTITVKLTDIQLEALYTKSSRVTSDNYIISTLRGLILQVYAADNVYELNDADDMNESVSGNDINDVGDTDTVDTTDQADTPNPAEDAGQAEEPATTEASDQSETFVSYEGKLVIECIPDPELEGDSLVIGDMTITLFDVSLFTTTSSPVKPESIESLGYLNNVVTGFSMSLLYMDGSFVMSGDSISFNDLLRLYYEFDLNEANIATILSGDLYYVVPIPDNLTVLQHANSLPADLKIEGTEDAFAMVDVVMENGTNYLVILFYEDVLKNYNNGLYGCYIDVVCALDKDDIKDKEYAPIKLSDSSELEIWISELSAYEPEIKKTGTYDPVTGTITWTIEYTHGNVLDDDGKSIRTPVYITDVFIAADQSFADGSLKVGGTLAEQEYVTLANISALAAGEYTCDTTTDNSKEQLIYKLPDDLNPGDTLTITYQTLLTDTTLRKILDYDGTATLITNNAQVRDTLEKDPIDFDIAKVDVTGEDKLWLQKIGTYVEYDEGKGGYIEWTLVVNIFSNTMTSLKLHDQMEMGLTFDDTTVKINSVSLDECEEVFELDYNIGSNSFEITFPYLPKKEVYKITYITFVDRENYESGEDAKLRNKAWLEFEWPDGVGPGGLSITDPMVDKPINIASSSLEKSGFSGYEYNKVTHTITWEITINPHKVNIDSGILTDTLLSYGQKYVGGTFKLEDDKWADKVIVISDNIMDVTYDELKVAIADIGENSVTFTFDAEVIAESIWADNQVDKIMENVASMVVDIIPEGGTAGSVTLEAKGTVLLNIDVLKKESEAYDYINQTITWQVTVNADKIPMDDANLEDKLPAGLSYDPESVVVKKSDETIIPLEDDAVKWDSSTRDLTIKLGCNANEEKLVVTYKTKVNPNEMINSEGVNEFWTENSVEFKNSVTLERNGTYITEPVVDTVTIDGPIVSKDGTLVTPEGKVEYTIELNPNKLDMASKTNAGTGLYEAVITDYLPDGMLLDLSSVKLCLATINDKGKLQSTDKFVTLIPNVNLVYGIHDGTNASLTGPLGQYFQIALSGYLSVDKEGNPVDSLTQQRYILTYEAYLFTNATNTYKNVVTIDGHEKLPEEAESTVTVYKASGGARAITFNSTARVQITKSDFMRPDIMLEGVTFELYEVVEDNGAETEILLYTDSTNKDGVVLFGGLVSGHKYNIYETASIYGYPIDGDSLSGKKLVETISVSSNELGKLLPVKVTNIPKTGSFNFTKILQETDVITTATAGAGTATFVATDRTKNDLDYTYDASSDTNGIVTFKDMPFGIYEITEIVTPDYYKLAYEAFFAVIDTDGNFVGFYGTYDDAVARNNAWVNDIVTNIRKTINLTLTKTDVSRGTSAVYINGVEFTIYQSSTNLKLTTGTSLASLTEPGGVLAEYTVFDKSTTKFVSGTTTGRASFDGLEQGYYYYVFETKAPDGYKNNLINTKVGTLVYIYTPSNVANGTQVTPSNITNDPIVGGFSFKKYGSEAANTKYLMENVSFTATDQTRRYPGSTTNTAISNKSYTGTNENGTVTFSKLPFGVYLVTENLPDYYTYSNNATTFSFFAVIGTDGNAKGFYTTLDDANSALASSTEAPNVNNYEVTNVRKSFSLSFTKYDNRNDEYDPEEKVLVQNGATFKLYRGGLTATIPNIDPSVNVNSGLPVDTNYIFISEAYSDGDGVVTFTYTDSDAGLKYLEQGYYYYLYETSVPEGYTDVADRLVATILAIDQENKAPYNYTDYPITNTPGTNEFEFIKYGTEYGKLETLSGASFTAIDQTANSAVEKTELSGDDGVVKFTNMPFGVYKIMEDEQPPFYKSLNDSSEPFYAVIDVESEFLGFFSSDTEAYEAFERGEKSQNFDEDYVIYNVRKTFNLSITKIDAMRQEITIEGVEFVLYRSLTKIADKDDQELVERITTDGKGTVVFAELLEQGYWYYIYEVYGPDGYDYNSDSAITSFFAEDDNDGYILKLDPSREVNVINNTPHTDDFSFYKKDENDELMWDKVKFTIEDVNYRDFNRTVTSKDGKFSFEDIPFGIYKITETEIPKFYKVPEILFAVVSKEGDFLGFFDTLEKATDAFDDGENREDFNDDYTFKNERKTFRLKIKKLDSSTRLPIEGVTFSLYRAKSEDPDISDLTPVIATTDSVGEAVFGLVGSSKLYQGYWYFLYETDTPDGYTNNIDKSNYIAKFYADEGETEEEYDFVLTDKNERRDGNTVSNEPNTGTFSFTKVDEFGTMEGVTFIATDQNEDRKDPDTGDLVTYTRKSDKNGLVVFEDLPFGEYKIVEVDDDGTKGKLLYYMGRDELYIKISEDGSVREEDFYRLTQNEDLSVPEKPVSFISSENGGYIFRNQHEPHVLSIIKQDSRDGNVLVEGIKFEVYFNPARKGEEDKIDIDLGSTDRPSELMPVNKSRYKYETYTTNETGMLTLIGLEGGYWYYVYETPTRGYTDSDTPPARFVAAGFAEEDENIELYEYIQLLDNDIEYDGYSNFVENIPNEGKFSFIKVDENGSAMAEIKFTARDMTDGSKVRKIENSDENGKVEFSELPFGVYEITETIQKYYKQLVFYVKINEDGSFGGFYSTPDDAESGNAITRWATQDGGEIYNERKTSDLIITTTDSVSEAPIPGVIYELYEEGGTLPVDTQTTDAEGKIHFRKLKQGVTYEVVEITPEGYKPPANPVVYRFTPDDEEDGYVSTYPIEIDPLGSIAFNKVSDNSDALAGAEFRLTGVAEDGNKIAEMTAISNNDGIVRFENVPIGHYQIMEISAPDNYEKDEAVYYAEITRNPVYENLFEGLKDEAGALVEGNKVINKYIDPISYSAPAPSSYTKQTASSDASSEPDTGLEGALPQTGQNKILAATLCICGIVLTTIGAYGFRKRRNQKNEK